MNAVTPLRAETPGLFSVEAEQQVLGICLIDQRQIGRVVNAGGRDVFWDPVHGALFDLMAEADREGRLVSPITLRDAAAPLLEELGGAAYLARLASSAISTHAMSGYLGLLQALAHKRGLQTALTEAQQALIRGDDAGEIASRLETRMLGLDSAAQTLRPVTMLKAVADAMRTAQAAFNKEPDGSVKSGIAALDRIIPGFYPGELTLLGGRPSMGKSSVALGMAMNMARSGGAVAIASLEMTPEALAARALSESTSRFRTAVPYSSLRTGDLTKSQFQEVAAEAKAVASLPIYFLPRGYADLGSMVAGARQISRSVEGGLKMLIVDYAQLLRAEGRSRYDQITAISMALKALAVQMHIPVIALSQLSRDIEKREDRRPVMSDLRESGQLEQDADNVIFCYRPGYYLERDRPKSEDPAEDHIEWEAKMRERGPILELIVAKQRNGTIGTAICNFAPATGLIWEA